jgi:hypothetical protein
MHKIGNFNEGHSIVGEWQGRGRGTAEERHGNGMVRMNRPLTYWNFHSMHRPVQNC